MSKPKATDEDAAAVEAVAKALEEADRPGRVDYQRLARVAIAALRKELA